MTNQLNRYNLTLDLLSHKLGPDFFLSSWAFERVFLYSGAFLRWSLGLSAILRSKWNKLNAKMLLMLPSLFAGWNSPSKVVLLKF